MSSIDAPGVSMKFKSQVTTALTTALLLAAPAAHSQSVMDQCRAYARAIEAVATARDNLDEPKWEKLVELHPILKENGKNDRAVLFAELINLRLIHKNASPQALKNNSFESCPTTYSCIFLNESCPKK